MITEHFHFFPSGEDTYVNCINENKGPSYCPFYRHGTDYNTMRKYRTIDGTCNNLRRPNYGAINTKLRRLLRKSYIPVYIPIYL